MSKHRVEFDLKAYGREMRGKSPEAQTLWHWMLMYMYISTRSDGTLPNTATKAVLCEVCGLTPHKYDKALRELEDGKVFSRTPEGVIYSRRIRREANPDRTALNKAFDTLVDHYPNATMVSAARSEWQRLIADGIVTTANVQEVLDGLDRWKASKKWHEDGGQYIPSLVKWLTEKRWMDRPQQDLALGRRRSKGGTDPMAIYDPEAEN